MPPLPSSETTEKTVQESDFNVFWNAAGAVVLETQAGPDTPLMKRSLADWQTHSTEETSPGPFFATLRLAVPRRPIPLACEGVEARGVIHGLRWRQPCMSPILPPYRSPQAQPLDRICSGRTISADDLLAAGALTVPAA